MTHTTITVDDFLKGCRPRPKEGRTHHAYRAEIVGKGVQVFDKDGNRVEVTFAGTTDNRTVYAYVKGDFYIGGWQYPHKKLPFTRLVDSINKGVGYFSMDALPKSSKESGL